MSKVEKKQLTIRIDLQTKEQLIKIAGGKYRALNALGVDILESAVKNYDGDSPPFPMEGAKNQSCHFKARISPELKEALVDIASKEQRTLKTVVGRMLAQGVAGRGYSLSQG